MMKSQIKAAVLILVLTVLPAQSLADVDWKLVRLSFSSGWDALPAIVAIERGLFTQEGLIVSGLTVSSAEGVLNSMAKGSTDMASVPQRTLLVMAALQMPVKVISMSGWGTEMELVVPKEDTTVKSIADLKGKTIGVGLASEAFPVLVRLLNKAKLRPTDVTIKYLPAEGLTQAFLQTKKLADAVIESRHFTSVLTKNEHGRVVLTNKDIVDSIGLIEAMPVVVRKAMIEQEPDTVQKFVTAWVKALKYIQQDPDDSARLLLIFFHRQGVLAVSEELTKSWVAMTRYNRYSWTPADVSDAEYNGWALKEGGVLKVLPKLDGYVENRFAQEAVKKVGEGAVAKPKAGAPPAR
jgi:ABC-type nitrate/sulfonate/bicarbonate transport system substrate-binding protein